VKPTRQRIHDTVKRDLLAPLEPPHPFGTKRPSLEQDYYEQLNKPNIHLVNTKAHPIIQLTPDGIMTEDGSVYEEDIIALATGFDATTGALAKWAFKMRMAWN
jgi:cation diffusion facilitator CzcD-associated flavoprotein CzcO